MKKLAVCLFTALLIIAIPSAAEAKNNKKDKKKNNTPTVTMSMKQFQMLLEMIAAKPETITIPTPKPEQGEAGKPGATGPKGDRGSAGSTGARGPAGPAGEPGQDGENGVGFSQGAIFLVNGSCPEGTTMQGAQNRWTVYANDTTGRPWLTSGSSAQLFLSACLVS